MQTSFFFSSSAFISFYLVCSSRLNYLNSQSSISYRPRFYFFFPSLTCSLFTAIHPLLGSVFYPQYRIFTSLKLIHTSISLTTHFLHFSLPRRRFSTCLTTLQYSLTPCTQWGAEWRRNNNSYGNYQPTLVLDAAPRVPFWPLFALLTTMRGGWESETSWGRKEGDEWTDGKIGVGRYLCI